MIYAIPKYMIH